VNDVEVDLREVVRDDMNWIDLAEDRDHWRADVNTVMNLGFHKMLAKLLNSC
jgi:hypothetical protein